MFFPDLQKDPKFVRKKLYFKDIGLENIFKNILCEEKIRINCFDNFFIISTKVILKYKNLTLSECVYLNIFTSML